MVGDGPVTVSAFADSSSTSAIFHRLVILHCFQLWLIPRGGIPRYKAVLESVDVARNRRALDFLISFDMTLEGLEEMRVRSSFEAEALILRTVERSSTDYQSYPVGEAGLTDLEFNLDPWAIILFTGFDQVTP